MTESDHKFGIEDNKRVDAAFVTDYKADLPEFVTSKVGLV
jgi:hypothetical protein